ncbi:MAG: HAD family hydrolase, partial [Streptosporangiaceae bacterium]
DDGAFSCGGWTARGLHEHLELDGNGERIDGLRALCAAAWTAQGVTPDSVRPAIERLDRAR